MPKDVFLEFNTLEHYGAIINFKSTLIFYEKILDITSVVVSFDDNLRTGTPITLGFFKFSYSTSFLSVDHRR